MTGYVRDNVNVIADVGGLRVDFKVCAFRSNKSNLLQNDEDSIQSSTVN